MPTSNKPRDYAAEYKRRMARAAERGFSKDVARGHPRKGRLGITEARKTGRRPGVPRESQPTESEIYQAELFAAGFRDPLKEGRRAGLSDLGVADTRIDAVITSQRKFVRVAIKAGLTEREAYSLWYSP